MKSLCVFCGSSPGNQPLYTQIATQVGREIAVRGWRLVYGGGNVGLMGIVADAVLEGGGEVIGVIPQGLVDREVAHFGLTELIVVGSMHERKALMAEKSDGFLALPGGFGTFDELCEILTWAQLGLHGKPIAILNPGGYYDTLLALFDHATGEGFVRPNHREMVWASADPVEILDRLAAAEIRGGRRPGTPDP